MGEAAKKLTKPSLASSSEQSTNELIKDRQSKELVIAFCGAVGAGVKRVKEPLVKQLKGYGYRVKVIRVSDLLREHAASAGYPDHKKLEELEPDARYIELQQLGNFYRKNFGLSFPAELAISRINEEREVETEGTPQKTAYLIDQVKHPQEVEVLRLVYQNNFYLLGLYRERFQRKSNLKKEGISPEVADRIIETDRKESDRHGQQLEKTFHISDYFITNEGNVKVLEDKTERFVALVHGGMGCSPSIDEKGMYSAYSASLNSLCLSRQVGASILDKKGNILSVGFNDAPSYGGGLYNSDMAEDNRCLFKGKKCYNDEEKQKIQAKVSKLVKGELKDSLSSFDLKTSELNKMANDIVRSLNSETKIGSLIEFSRAIHAEMEALLSLTRTGGASSIGTTLYSTTYPCHNCARHIVAAGIEKVVFIEPYEKSMAISLHDDAISETNEKDKVSFSSFEGVSPRSYDMFFRKVGKVKNKQGAAIDVVVDKEPVVSMQFLDNYMEIEDKVSEKVFKRLKLDSM